MSDLFFEADVQSPMISAVFIPPQSDQLFDHDGAIAENSDDDLLIPAESNDMGEVIVTGTRNNGVSYWFEFRSSLENFDGYPTADETYDSGGGETASYFDFLQAECQADLTTDSLARQIEALIKAQPDWNAREYGAYIYMVGNEVKMTEIFRGTTLAEAQAQGLTSPYVNFPSLNIGDGVILAAVHSHPDIGYDPDLDLVNRYPSDFAGGGDYSAYQALVETNVRFGNNAAFAQYILGPDGVLREFNFSEGRVTAATDAAADAAAGNNDATASRSNLAKDRPCDS